MFGPAVEAARFGLRVVGVAEAPWFARGDGLSAACAGGSSGVDGGFEFGAQSAVCDAVASGGWAWLGSSHCVVLSVALRWLRLAACLQLTEQKRAELPRSRSGARQRSQKRRWPRYRPAVTPGGLGSDDSVASHWAQRCSAGQSLRQISMARSRSAALEPSNSSGRPMHAASGSGGIRVRITATRSSHDVVVMRRRRAGVTTGPRFAGSRRDGPESGRGTRIQDSDQGRLGGRNCCWHPVYRHDYPVAHQAGSEHLGHLRQPIGQCDRVTQLCCRRAGSYALCGADLGRDGVERVEPPPLVAGRTVSVRSTEKQLRDRQQPASARGGLGLRRRANRVDNAGVVEGVEHTFDDRSGVRQVGALTRSRCTATSAPR